MVTGQNDDFYCPRCGVSDNLQQTVKTISNKTELTIKDIPLALYKEFYEFNCGVCKFKSFIGVTND